VSSAVGSPILRAVQAGLAGAVALAVVLSLVATPRTAAEERARRDANDALARSGVTPVGGPVVVEKRSLFDEPGAAVALALGCAAVGAAVGSALGWAARRRGGALRGQLVPVMAVGIPLTIAALATAGLLRTRELLGFAAFWAVTAVAVVISERSPRRRPPL